MGKLAGLGIVITMVLTVLKGLGFIALPWTLVLFPMFVIPVMYIGMLYGMFLTAFFRTLIDEDRKRK